MQTFGVEQYCIDLIYFIR